VKKMVDLGWTEPGYFANKLDTVALQHCVAWYHACVLAPFSTDCTRTLILLYSFLNIMAESPASFFVPTLDIDLGWHTHQLMASRYQNDCLSLVGRHVDQ